MRFFDSSQFERACVRNTLARGTPLAFQSWPRLRNAVSATATPDLHFWISISFCKIATRTSLRSFHVVFASPRGHPAVPYFSRHAVARSIASARVNNKEASPPGTYLIVFFSWSDDHGFRWRGASSHRARLIGLLVRRTLSAEHSGDPSIAGGQSFGLCL